MGKHSSDIWNFGSTMFDVDHMAGMKKTYGCGCGD